MLNAPDSFHLSAALGWLELGNHFEAIAELEKIAPQLQAHPDVLDVKYGIHAAAKTWGDAAAIAQTLVEMVPTEPGNWINLAYATRRKPNGSIAEAKVILQKAATIFPAYCMIFYNLACYDCQLGNLALAKQWLARALELGHKESVKKMSLNDSDLEPLWKEIEQI